MKKHEHSGCTKKAFENPKEILISAGVEKDTAFLDIGTGSGYLSIAASEITGPGGTIYALDSHEQSIIALSQELKDKGITNISPVLADAVKEIPLTRDIIDICLMSNVMHGFAANEETDRVLKNINTVLKDGGKLVVIDFKKEETSFGPPLSIKLSPEEVENIISPYGYVMNKQIEVSSHHYGIVFNKICLQDKHC